MRIPEEWSDKAGMRSLSAGQWRYVLTAREWKGRCVYRRVATYALHKAYALLVSEGSGARGRCSKGEAWCYSLPLFVACV